MTRSDEATPGPASPRFDHVVIAVKDLEAAAGRLANEYGLATVPGGRHPGHGTGNRLAPLGDSYLELMAVLDREEATGSPLGRFVTRFTAAGEGLMALCLRTEDIETVASRIGSEPAPMSRVTPDGTQLSWRLAGLGDALSPARLPFFIQWDIAPELLPGRTPVEETPPGGISWVEWGGDAEALERRLGDHDLDLRVHAGGEPGIRSVGLGGLRLTW